MKGRIKCVSSLFLTMILAFSFIYPANAIIVQPMASDYISNYSLTISSKSSNKIIVTIDVEATGTFAYVGLSALSIQVYENGSWKNVAIYNGFASGSSIMGRNTSAFAKEVTYTGQAGKTYRAVGDVYCGKDSSYINCDTRTGVTTSSVVAKL